MLAAVFGDTLWDILKSVHVLCAALWVGGNCPALYLRPMAGVLPVQTLQSLQQSVAQWRMASISADRKS